MNILVLGGTGNTGKFILEKLLDDNHNITVIIRENSHLPDSITNSKNMTIIKGTILEYDNSKIQQLVENCDVVISSLGHNLSFKGIFCKPRALVTQTLKKISFAIKKNQNIKLILMNSAGVKNRDLNEPIPFSQKCIIFLLKILLPPHLDNENAADFLRTEVSQVNKNIQWICIRPDTLVDTAVVSEYEVFSSPRRSAIFNAGQTSRINIADFMSKLISNEQLWSKWREQMPVIYNKEKC